MKIKEVLKDIKFEQIVFYLEQNSFSKIEDLDRFDFDELYFVPGVDDSLIEEVRNIYEENKNVCSDDNEPIIEVDETECDEEDDFEQTEIKKDLTERFSSFKGKKKDFGGLLLSLASSIILSNSVSVT